MIACRGPFCERWSHDSGSGSRSRAHKMRRSLQGNNTHQPAGEPQRCGKQRGFSGKQETPKWPVVCGISRDSALVVHSLQKGVHMVIVKRLAKAVGVDRAPLARALTPLERQGRMRSAPGEDRRERRVTIPTRGQQAWAEGVPLGETAQAHVVRGSGRERLQRVLSDLATRGILIRQR